MLKFNFTPFPTLQTERLVLRELVLADTEDYFQIRSNPTVMKYLARPQAETSADAEKIIRRTMESLAENKGICWAICLADNPKLIGTIGYYRTQFEHYRTEIGYELSPEFWGKGMASEAMQAVLDYMFLKTEVHSVEANIDPVNRASAKILERNNFIREAFFRENYFFEGRFTDSAIYSLLKSRHLALTGQLELLSKPL